MESKSKLLTQYQAPKRGDRIKASDLQRLKKSIDRMNRQQDDTGNFAFPEPKDAFRPALKPKTAGGLQIGFLRGYICERITAELEEANQVRFILPDQLVDEVTGETIWHDIAEDQVVYVKYATDNKGKIKDDPKPEIFVGEDDIASTNFYPAVGNYTGQEGEYLYKICKAIVKDEIEFYIEWFHVGGHIQHYAERVTIENVPVYPTVGEGEDYRGVIKDYDPAADKVTVKKIKQLGGAEGEPILKPFEAGETEANKETIDFRRIAERDTGIPQINVVGAGNMIRIQGNGVDASAGGITVVDGLVTELNPDGAGVTKGTGDLKSKGADESVPTTHIEWEEGFVKTNGTVTIKDRSSNPQIKVKSAAGTVTIEGNGYDASAGGTTIVDGLVTALGAGAIGWWGTVTFIGVNPVGSPPSLALVFENGLLVDVIGGSYTSGSGTEADPGFNDLQVFVP